uniref:Uncharacterized protein n=1 Tax=Oryza sativa subsp. japonica TaxID=39947 RepID=Q6H598_ORYSJ|nr:hypothetical protein [Oryza sativa Japonica Group]BAD26101.1 hypothetical protein [Oryza sativa Japonica Group]
MVVLSEVNLHISKGERFHTDPCAACRTASLNPRRTQQWTASHRSSDDDAQRATTRVGCRWRGSLELHWQPWTAALIRAGIARASKWTDGA